MYNIKIISLLAMIVFGIQSVKADNELTNYIKISEAENVYVTHGREEAIVHWCKKNNINGLALSLSGREDEEEL